ncbi:MAG: thioredoxin-dependent thiol peroxidase [Bacteroidota bacterium]|jgi:peroxiredoxin Q/BCP|nr:thioredoxin-dependent thiol peroxidase [Bacteroidota bacterium]
MSIQIGKKAPAIKGVDQNGAKISLADFKGKKVALYFYPKDNTPGCTAQACNLEENSALLKKKGIVVVGVSTDSVASHKKFETKFNLSFPLIADESKEIVTAYEVWGEKKFMGRTYMGTNRVTFLINEKGIIEHVIDKVETKNHAAQVLSEWGLD